MFLKSIAIALLCATIITVQASALDTSSNSSSSISTSSNSSNLLSSNSQNSSTLSVSSTLSTVSSLSNSNSSISQNANSQIDCKLSLTSQIAKIDDDKVECENSDIESEKDDKSKEIITKKEKNRYKQCKRDEENRRKSSRKSSETACKKKPKKITHNLTDEDYNILFDSLDATKRDVKPPSSTVTQSSKINLVEMLTGSVKVSAGITDGFTLPFAKGTKVTVQQDVNDGVSHGQGGSHAALDMTGGVNYGESIKASKTGTVIFTRSRAETGFGNHVVVQLDDGGYAIYAHLSSISVSSNTKVNKGDEIGKMGNTGLSDPNATHIHLETISSLPSCKYSVNDQYNSNQVSVNNCWTSLPSIVLKPQFVECYSGVQSEMNTCGYLKINNVWTYPNVPTYPNIYTSQNQSTQPYNNYGAQVWPQDNGSFRWDVFGAYTADQSRVKLWGYNGGIAQRWGYDSNTRQIKGINDKCLDAGDVNNPNNRWLRISTCHNGSNQKWFLDTIGRIHSEAKTSLCVDSPQGNTQGSDLYMGACHHGNNQKWTGNLSMNSQETFLPIRSAYNQSYGFNIYGGTNTNETPIRMWGLGNNQWNEAFEYNSTSQEIRNKLGKCVDAWDTNNPSNRWLRINDCNGGSNQKFWADTSYRLHSNSNGNLCIDSQNGDNYNSTIYMGNCYDGKNQKWWVQGWLS